jgi:ACR3 family arsenite efflux pump ArsB
MRLSVIVKNVLREPNVAAVNQYTERVKSWWVELCLAIGGIAWNWWFAFEWFFGKHSLWSTPVLRVMVITVVLYPVLASLGSGVSIE